MKCIWAMILLLVGVGCAKPAPIVTNQDFSEPMRCKAWWSVVEHPSVYQDEEWLVEGYEVRAIVERDKDSPLWRVWVNGGSEGIFTTAQAAEVRAQSFVKCDIEVKP